ncbi:rab11 family-interacting protein 2 [Scleropages formosus]|uniref:Rab11 family-interacting protein 2 n=2 Tax=Scleropages formosus TaxID=113540 RepID=A0A8C9R6M5_SCLFO|nr:rab11 family-interacting protein 2 [Scleropages formosus]XP_018593533.1 rab11 family-interacting protein 2 [Scleropages formosus]
MSLSEQSQKWFPTHVQATVLQAKELQPKGKNGTNDAYAIIQLGKEKYSTSVSEKTLNPVWREEASFELPGLLLEGNPEIHELCLIVMHRSLVGMDKFLGQKTINLNDIFDNKERRRTDWFRLESKPGKKRKDRGQIQVSIQFMRNNMTASMFDLSVKEKPRSPFSKLKDRMKGRKHDGLFPDTFSAIVPRSTLGDADSPFSTGVSAGDTQLNSKKKRPQLLGPQKLSAAQSMSDLIHSWPKNESRNVTEESGRTLSPHKRSQSEVPECKAEASQVHSDSFAGIIEALPHKYATLPRNHNPFEGDRSMTWDKVDKKEKKEKVSLLERVTGKKDGRSVNSDCRSDSFGDLRCPNPFSSDASGDTNPFIQHYKTSGNVPKNHEDINSGVSKHEENQDKNNDAKQVCLASYNSMSFPEVVQELIKQKEMVKKKDAHIRELEDYIDDLLVRVMEETPSILRKPYEPKKKAGKFPK